MVSEATDPLDQLRHDLDFLIAGLKRVPTHESVFIFDVWLSA